MGVSPRYPDVLRLPCLWGAFPGELVLCWSSVGKSLLAPPSARIEVPGSGNHRGAAGTVAPRRAPCSGIHPAGSVALRIRQVDAPLYEGYFTPDHLCPSRGALRRALTFC